MRIWFVIGLGLVAVLVFLGLKKASTKETISSTPDKIKDNSWLSKLLAGGASAIGIKTGVGLGAGATAGAGAGATATGTVTGAAAGISAIGGLALAGFGLFATFVLYNMFKSRKETPEQKAERERKTAEAMAYYNAMLPKVKAYLSGKG